MTTTLSILLTKLAAFSGSKVKVHGVATRKTKQFFYQILDDVLNDIGLTGIDAVDIVDVIDGYQLSNTPGLTRKDIMQMTEQIASSTGVICDATYGGIAINALKHEFSSCRHRFNGKRILYIHTGGLFSIFDRNLPVVINEKSTEIDWKDAQDSLLNFL